MSLTKATSRVIADNTITNFQIASNAAILGTKILPNFGTQNILTTGDVLINTTSAFQDSNSTPSFQMHSTSLNEEAEIGMFHFQNTGSGGIIMFCKSRGGADNTHGLVQSADDLGFIGFEGSDGTKYIRSASLLAEVDGTPGVDNMPGRFIFATTAAGASAPTERMRLDSNGDLTLTAGSLILSQDINSRVRFGVNWSILNDEESFSIRETEDGDVEAYRISDEGSPGEFRHIFRGNSSSYCTISEDATITARNIRLTGGGDVSLTSTGHAFQIGSQSGVNIAIDSNEIQARDNNDKSPIYLNISGGTIQLGLKGTDNDLFAPTILSNTTSSGANVRVNTNTGLVLQVTSSIRYKKDVENIEPSYSNSAIFNSRPVWFRSKSKNDNPSWSYWGFLAEEIAEIDPRLADWALDENGNLQPHGVQYDRFVPHICVVLKEQKQTIENLEQRLNLALTKIAELESKIQS